MVMDDFRSILRRAGNVLIVIGVIDVGVMVACILTQTAYSSSLNVFAILAGIMLRRGSLGAAVWVARISALCLGMLPVGLMLSRLEPWSSLFRAKPGLLPQALAMAVVLSLLAIWLLRELRRKPVLDAMKLTGQRFRPPYVAWLIGFVGFGGMCLLLRHVLDNPTAHHAVEVARAKYGMQYEYTVTRMSWTPHHAHAELSAHNDRETKTVTVDFDTP